MDPRLLAVGRPVSNTNRNFKIPSKIKNDHEYKKLDGSLNAIVNMWDRGEKEQAGKYAEKQGIIAEDGLVKIVIEAREGQAESIKKSLEDAGARIQSSYNDLVQVLCPISNLATLSGSGNISLIRKPLKPKAQAMSEGVARIGADAWQTAGFDGTGAKVAILDLGFEGYQSLLGSDLPSQVTTMSFRSDGDITGGGIAHGTACSEIIYDVAPGAELYLVNFDTDVELANAVEYLKSQHVDIINHAIAWYNTDYGNGSGPIDKIADDAVVNGILWLNAAGNHGETHWKGQFTDSDYDGIHEFDPSSGDIGNAFYADAGEPVSIWLRWPLWGNSYIDYDLYLCDAATDEVVAFSENYQTGPEPPIEEIDTVIPASGEYYIALVNYTSPYVNIEVEIFADTRPLEYCVSEESLVCPSDADGVVAVGATDVLNDQIESYSSRGKISGYPFKPELTSPDGVTTQLWGKFYGTSAAVSHASGTAALAKGRFPAYTYLENHGFLEGRAVDLGSTGHDYVYGYGRINMPNPSIISNTFYISTSGSDITGDGTQGNPYLTIQKGIDSSSQGDKIYVESGTYDEDIELKAGISLQGEGQDTTIIQGTGFSQVIIKAIDLHQCVKIDGLSVTNQGPNSNQGGIYCTNSDLVLTNNHIFGNGSPHAVGGGIGIYGESSLIAKGNRVECNSADIGAGIRISGRCVSITSNVINENTAYTYGGGIYIGSGTSLIANNLINLNSATYGEGAGGGVHLAFTKTAELVNNTVVNNQAPTAGGIGASSTDVGTFKIFNCIIWGNGDDLYNCTATYSDIQDGDSGVGNISQDPQFIYGLEDTFALSATSPCIDKGTNNGAPAEDIRTISRPQDGDNNGTATTDMGAYEFRYPQTVYVDDSNATGIEDGTIAHPFNTIGEANTAAENGDIIQVADGDYTDAPGGNGESFPLYLKPVKLISDNGPAATIIECTGLTGPGPAAIWSSGYYDQGISGFTLRGGQRSTLQLADAFVEIENNIIEESDACGIIIGQESGESMYSGGFIYKNIIRNNGGPGIVAQNKYSVAVIENNFIYNNSSAGGSGWDAAGISVTVNTGDFIVAYINNNTIVDNTGGNGVGVNFTGTGLNDPANYIFLTNDIIWGNTVDLNGWTATYSDIGTGNVAGTGNISQNPLFISPQTGDYRFDYGSPCVDKGILSGTIDDFFGNPRPALGGCDIGAYECQIGAFNHFTISQITSPKTAGQAFPITVTAKDAYENTITDFTGTANLTDLTTTITPTTTTSFTSGVWTGNVTITQGYVSNRITATSVSPSVTGQSNIFNVNAPSGTPEYRGAYQVSGGFTNPMTPGGKADFIVQLTNTGSLVWKKSVLGVPNAVNLAFHWYNAQGQCVAWDCVRTVLTSDVYYNQTVPISVQITAPNVPGSVYVLKFDLVREGVTWFSSQGVSMSANQTANIGSNYGATYNVSNGFPNPMQPGGQNTFTVQLTNTGLQAWNSTGPNPVKLAFHWYDGNGNLVAWDCVRTVIPDVPAGSTTSPIPVTITTPNVPGSTYILKFDLVKEGMTWFSSQGVAMSANQTAHLSNYGATYEVTAGGFPNPMTPGSKHSFTVHLTNTGYFDWVMQGNGANPVNLAFHWYDINGNLVAWDCVRAKLNHNVVREVGTDDITTEITAPNVPNGVYILRFDLVREGVTWFSSQGVSMSSDQIVNMTSYGATYNVTGGFPSPTMPAGTAALFTVQLANTGQFTWIRQGDGANPVRLAFHWYNGAGQLVAWDCVRADLTKNVVAGDTDTIVTWITTPNVPGATYILKFDLVREGVTWFSSKGVPLSASQTANLQ
jgi:hypothetical protein